MARKSRKELQQDLLLTIEEIEACLPNIYNSLKHEDLNKIASSLYDFSKLILDNFNFNNL